MSVLRVACLGAGYFARFHHDGWRRIEGAALVAVADHDLARAQAACSPGAALGPATGAATGAANGAANGAAPFPALAPMLAAARPDILDIITPPPTHLPAIRMALDAGVRAIICQKPFCGDLAAAREAAALAEAAGARLIVHENFRFQPWYRAIRAAIERGAIGEVHQATFRLRPGDGQGAGAYLDRQPYFRTMPRLLIHETAVHWVDVFRYLLGDPVAVQADLRRLNPAIAGEDAGHVLTEHASGARSLFDGNRHLDHCAADPRLTMGEALVEGTGGALTLSGDGAVHLRAHGARTRDPILPAQAWPGWGGDCVRALQAHAVAGLRGEAPLENEAAAYLRVLETEAAIYRAADTHARAPVADTCAQAQVADTHARARV
jgi:predicted dehydrogenase